MLKLYKGELKELKVLEDLGSNISSILNSEEVKEEAERLFKKYIHKNSLYIQDEYISRRNFRAGQYRYFLHEVDGEVQSSKFNEVLTNNYSLTEQENISTLNLINQKLEASGVDIDRLRKNIKPNHMINDRYLYVFAHRPYMGMDEELSYHTIISELAIPVHLDDDMLMFGSFRIEVAFSKNDIVQDREGYSKELFTVRATPLSAIVYTEKYNVRLYANKVENEKLANNIYLPHAIPSDYSFIYYSDMQRTGYVFVSDEEIREEILNHQIGKDFLKEVKERLNPNKNYGGNNEFSIKDVKSNPEILLDNINCSNMNTVLSSMEKSSGKAVDLKSKKSINELNLQKHFSISDADLQNNISSMVYSKYKSALVNKTDRSIICSKCMRNIENPGQDRVAQCECGENYFYSSNTVSPIQYYYNLDGSNGEEYDVLFHGKIESEDVENGLLKEGVNLDPLSIGFSQLSYTNSVQPKKKLFVNDAKMFEDDLVIMTRLFNYYLVFADSRNSEKEFFTIGFNRKLVSIDGEMYFETDRNNSNRYNVSGLSEEMLSTYNKTIPSKIDPFVYSDLICLNKEESLKLHEIGDEYNLLDLYLELMEIEKDSEDHYASLALLEGVYANYIKFFPKLEALMKSQFKDVATDIFKTSLDKREIRRIFDINKNRPKDICKLNTSNIKISNFNDSMYNLSTIRNINYVQYISEFCDIEVGDITSYTLNMFEVWSHEPEMLRTMIKKVAEALEGQDLSFLTGSKCIEYAGRCYDAQGMELDEVRDYWRDYVSMSIDIQADLSKEKTLYTDSLKRDHDVVARVHRLYANDFEKEKFKNFVEREDYKRLEYVNENDEFAILVPRKTEDVVNEGIALNHCVGSYVRSISKGSTKIVFLRRLNDLERSFYTIEVSKNSVVQVRSFRNRGMVVGSREEAFLHDWAAKKDLNIRY